MLPPLTTIQMSCTHLAAAAVDALRAGVEPDNPNASRKEWHIPTRLVVRQSSAYPRGSLPALSKSSAAGRHNLMKE
jgi:DNA-binding LacI/PurR family transcriptional regulator